MKCPYCDNIDTKVIDSRPTEEGHAIRRRRGCDKCGRRFTTYEKVEESILMVIKSDGKRREAFDRNKLYRGIARSCEKRPVSAETIERMVNDIERDLNNLMVKEVIVLNNTILIQNTLDSCKLFFLSHFNTLFL